MKVAVLSSGSKGNCTLVVSEKSKILIDAGVTKTYIENKLSELAVDPAEIKAIFISHTHVDHIQGLRVFIKKYNPVIFATEKLLPELQEAIGDFEFCLYDDGVAIVDDIKVEIIKTSHDSGESVGFIISDGTSSMVHITDTGYINNKYFNKLSNHNLYVFESNHDIEMLMTGEYPYYLKRRILGNKGHLSNDDAAFYLSELVGSKTKTIVLAHLSDDNNTYEKAISSVVNTLNSKHKKVNKVIVAKQKERTDFIKL